MEKVDSRRSGITLMKSLENNALRNVLGSLDHEGFCRLVENVYHSVKDLYLGVHFTGNHEYERPIIRPNGHGVVTELLSSSQWDGSPAVYLSLWNKKPSAHLHDHKDLEYARFVIAGKNRNFIGGCSLSVNFKDEELSRKVKGYLRYYNSGQTPDLVDFIGWHTVEQNLGLPPRWFDHISSHSERLEDYPKFIISARIYHLK